MKTHQIYITKGRISNHWCNHPQKITQYLKPWTKVIGAGQYQVVVEVWQVADIKESLKFFLKAQSEQKDLFKLLDIEIHDLETNLFSILIDGRPNLSCQISIETLVIAARALRLSVTKLNAWNGYKPSLKDL